MRRLSGARHAAHIEFILSHGLSFLWFAVVIVNLPILYTHTPWGCLVEMKMYDILLLVEVTAGSADRSQSNVSICNI